jgi:hypothetical protein
MRSFLTFLSAFVVIFMMYSLFIITLTENNSDHFPNTYAGKIISPLKIKMSIEQIDSISAFENYKFTAANYYRDNFIKNKSGKD